MSAHAAAFPCYFPPQVAGDESQEGLTKREWFAAHAPAEPQPWFTPVMPPRPAIPQLDELSPRDRRAFDAEVPDLWPDECSPSLRAFCERLMQAREAERAWLDAMKRQRYVQWPWAWADAVLAAAAPEPRRLTMAEEAAQAVDRG